MAFTLKYHRVEDRITLGFVLPSGERRACWVTRRNFLLLIYRLSVPEDLATRVDSKQTNVSAGGNRNKTLAEQGPEGVTPEASLGIQEEEGGGPTPKGGGERPKIASKIGVVKTKTGFRVSFVMASMQSDDRMETKDVINLNISTHERSTLLEALCLKARQAGWDIDAAMKRFRSNQKKSETPLKSAMH